MARRKRRRVSAVGGSGPCPLAPGRAVAPRPFGGLAFSPRYESFDARYASCVAPRGADRLRFYDQGHQARLRTRSGTDAQRSQSWLMRGAERHAPWREPRPSATHDGAAHPTREIMSHESLATAVCKYQYARRSKPVRSRARCTARPPPSATPQQARALPAFAAPRRLLCRLTRR